MSNEPTYTTALQGSIAEDLRHHDEKNPRITFDSVPETLSPNESMHLIHELQVHQIELEIQNEELREAQEHLQLSQAQFFDFYDQAPVGYLTLNDKGLILESNLTAAKMIGVKKSALIKCPLSQFVIPEDHNTCYLYYRQLLNRKGWQNCELCLLRADGERLWVKLQTISIGNEADGALQLRVIINDINELKHANARYRDNQMRLQKIIDTVSNGIITFDQRSLIQSFNLTAETMFGYLAEEVIGSNIKVLMASPHHEEHDAFCAAYLRPGQPHIIDIHREIQGQRKDGTIFPLNLGIIEFYDGDVRYFTATLQDISERKQVEQALRESEERLALVMDANSEGFWDWDIQNDRVLHNRMCYELLGMNANNQEFTASSFTTLLHQDDRKGVLAKLRQAFAGTGQFHSEHRLRRADGHYIWVRENGIIVKRDESGKPLRMVGSFVDISDRKRSEQQQQELQNHYKRLLKLEVVNQTITAIAHDLNQTLSSAASYTDASQCLLQDEQEKPDKLIYTLDQSAQQIQRASHVAQNLFKFLRSEETVTAPLELKQIVCSIIDKLKRSGHLDGFKGALDQAKELPKVKANPLHLEAADLIFETFANGAEFLTDLHPEISGCLLLDVSTSQMTGPVLQKELVRRGIIIPIILFSGHNDIPLAVNTIQAGAVDFLTIPVESRHLIDCIQAALALNAEQQQLDCANSMLRERLGTLTERELEVLTLAVDGHSNKKIGNRLGISFRTVEHHRSNILLKTGADNLLQLARCFDALR